MNQLLERVNCRDHYAPLNPRFTFVFADVKNQEYNPKGNVSAQDFRSPCETASVDFAFATSALRTQGFA